MANDYREHLGGKDLGSPDLELMLAGSHPNGVLETYHAAVDSFDETIQAILGSAEGSAKREELEVALQRIIAGTAIYAYRTGVEDSV